MVRGTKRERRFELSGVRTIGVRALPESPTAGQFARFQIAYSRGGDRRSLFYPRCRQKWVPVDHAGMRDTRAAHGIPVEAVGPWVDLRPAHL